MVVFSSDLTHLFTKRKKKHSSSNHKVNQLLCGNQMNREEIKVALTLLSLTCGVQKHQKYNTNALRQQALGGSPRCLPRLLFPLVTFWSVSQIPCVQNRKFKCGYIIFSPFSLSLFLSSSFMCFFWPWVNHDDLLFAVYITLESSWVLFLKLMFWFWDMQR